MRVLLSPFRMALPMWVLASCLLVFCSAPAEAQLTTQGNPVFSTPTPKEQKIGPMPKAPFKAVVEFDASEGDSEGRPMGEIRLGDVELEGNKYYRTWLLKKHLKPILEKQGGVLDVAELESELKRINKQNAFKMKANLFKGQDGETNVRLEVYERQPWQITGFTDNLGRPGLGNYRGGASITNESLLGFGDKFKVEYVGAARDNLVLAKYQVPLNRKGGNVSVKYRYHWVNYDRKFTGGANLEGRDRNLFVIQIEQPIDKKRVWTPFVGTLFRHVTVDRNGTRLAKADPRPWWLGMKYNKPDKYGSTTVKAMMVVGQKWMGGDSKFWRTKMVTKRVIKLPHRQKVVLRAAFQVSPDKQPPVQNFPVGGAYSVRGYTEGLLNGDQGHFYSAEYFFPIPFLNRASEKLSDRVRGVAFFDFGQAWLDSKNGRFIATSNPSSKERTLLMGTGIGVRARLTQYLQGFADMAWGLGNRNLIEQNSDPTLRVHFGIRSDFLPKNYKIRGDSITTL